MVLSESCSWRQIKAEGQRTYYVNTVTNTTTWEKPSELFTAEDKALAKTNWKEYQTEDGKRYWYNTETKQSTWKYPLENILDPKEQFKLLCERQGVLDGSYENAIPFLVRDNHFWELDFDERLRIFTELRAKRDAEQQKAIRCQREQKTLDLVKLLQSRYYISWNEGSKLAEDDDIAAEAFSRLDIEPLDAEKMTALKQQLESIDLFQDLESLEESLRSRLSYPRDPRVLNVYSRAVTEAHERATLELDSESKEQCEQAAVSRAKFLRKLNSLNLDRKTHWKEVAPQLENEIQDLCKYPGSTPLDIFYSEITEMDKSIDADTKMASAALAKANKRIDQISLAEFEELANSKHSRTIYSNLKDEFFKKSRDNTRGDEFDGVHKPVLYY